jgi:methionine salvage enolase-phosphatase E1
MSTVQQDILVREFVKENFKPLYPYWHPQSPDFVKENVDSPEARELIDKSYKKRTEIKQLNKRARILNESISTKRDQLRKLRVDNELNSSDVLKGRIHNAKAELNNDEKEFSEISENIEVKEKAIELLNEETKKIQQRDFEIFCDEQAKKTKESAKGISKEIKLFHDKLVEFNNACSQFLKNTGGHGMLSAQANMLTISECLKELFVNLEKGIFDKQIDNSRNS